MQYIGECPVCGRCKGKGYYTDDSLSAFVGGPAGPRMPADELTPRQHALYQLMSDISEECYCAGWMHDNEYRLWRALLDPEDNLYGMGEIVPREIDQLKQLSAETGGWIYWLDDERDPDLPCGECGPRFVALDQWLTMYARHIEAAKRNAK